MNNTHTHTQEYTAKLTEILGCLSLNYTDFFEVMQHIFLFLTVSTQFCRWCQLLLLIVYIIHKMFNYIQGKQTVQSPKTMFYTNQYPDTSSYTLATSVGYSEYFVTKTRLTIDTCIDCGQVLRNSHLSTTVASFEMWAKRFGKFFEENCGRKKWTEKVSVPQKGQCTFLHVDH